MKIAICVKQVPDTASKISISQDEKEIESANIRLEMNPYDEYALEEAIRIKEKIENTEITVISLGEAQIKNMLNKALAIGADKAIHLESDRKFIDPLNTAKILAKELKENEYDLIFFGKKSVDNDHHQTGILVSELLGIEAVSCCTEYTVEENMIKIKREIEGIQEIYESKLPIIITQEKGKNEVRYPSLKDLMAAKKKPIENRKVEVEKDRITTSKLEYPETDRKPKIVGEGIEAVPELIKLLKEEAKII